MASALALAYIGVWGFDPVGSKGKVPGRELGGQSPPEAGDLLKLEVHNPKGICDHFCKNLKI